MSYNIAVYTAPAGSTNAFAGETIASATWNSIFTDISTALNQIGNPNLSVRVIVSFSNTNTDNPITVPILPGFTRYRVSSAVISGAAASLTAGSVALYTAASAGGVQVIGSTTLTVVQTTENTANNLQILNVSQVSISFAVSVLFFRTLNAASGGTNQGTVTLFIQNL